MPKYQGKVWADGEAGGTSIDAASLNKIERGVEAAIPSRLDITPTTDLVSEWTIVDDGSNSSGWVDRLCIWFKPLVGTLRQTFWNNEYGELRGMPAKSNTVGARWFVAPNAADYIARSETVPVVEVADQRDGTRTTLFGVYKGGRVTLKRLEVTDTRSSPNATPWFVENLNYTVSSTDTDHLRIFVNGVIKFWANEWHAIRGTSPYAWGDALVRAIRENGDGITGGEAFQVVDRRTGAPAPVMFGVRWTDGAITRNGIVMDGTYTLGVGQTAADIPAALPVGTVIFRKLA